jgi:hypothetical protein
LSRKSGVDTQVTGKEDDSKREEALADLRRLTHVILDNLEEGSKNRLFDPKDIRLLAATVNRSIRLYLRTLEKDRAKPRRKRQNESNEEIAVEG